MFLGVGLGALLMETEPERRARVFRMACLAASAAAMLLGIAAGHLHAGLFPDHDIHKAGVAYSLLRVGFALLFFGVLAWILEANGFPIAPLILGMLLGPMLEEHFVRSMIRSEGNWLAFVDRPISGSLALITLGIWGASGWFAYKRSVAARTAS